MLKSSTALFAGVTLALGSGASAQAPTQPQSAPSTTVSGITVTAPRLQPQSGPPRLELYDQRDFGGGGIIVVQATPNLLTRGFSDHARSARAVRGDWQLCNGPDYTPPCTVLRGDQPFLGDVQLSERISSARPLGEAPSGR